MGLGLMALALVAAAIGVPHTALAFGIPAIPHVPTLVQRDPEQDAASRRGVALLTSGGLAPCLSASVGYLIHQYNTIDPSIEIKCYRAGYKGLLTGDSFVVDATGRASALELVEHGGSPLGNSRVKLTNIDDCEAQGFVQKGELPLAVAAKQLVADGVTILHTIGGDDTNSQAAELAK
jgi:pyrophosphate--fructose-6-phosphate 1-phosphotransferase